MKKDYRQGARKLRGWTKIYRDILDNPIATKTSEHFAIWTYLQLKAAYKVRKIMFAGKEIALLPNQIITGRKQIAEQFKLSESKVQRILKEFEEAKLISQETKNKYRIITMLCYYTEELEQEEEQQTPQQTPQQTTQEIEVENIIAKWNALGVGQIKKISGKRLENTKTLIKEYGEEDFYNSIDLVSKSTFLLGGNERNWVITYDWFITSSNYIKVSEGNYNREIKPQIKKNYTNMQEHDYDYDELEELDRAYIDKKIEEYKEKCL